jgi:hypothetical protein
LRTEMDELQPDHLLSASRVPVTETKVWSFAATNGSASVRIGVARVTRWVIRQPGASSAGHLLLSARFH